MSRSTAMNERVRTIADSFGQSTVRVRCACTQLLLLGMLLVFAESPAHAQSPELVSWYCPYCNRYYDMNASCPHTSGGTGSGGKSKKKSSYSHDMNMMIIETVGEAIQNAIIAKQKAQQKAQKQAQDEALAAQAKAAALAAQQKAQKDEEWRQRWNMRQSEAQREKAAKQVAGQRVLSTLIGSSGENAGQLAPLGAFQWDKPRTDLQLMPAGSVLIGSSSENAGQLAALGAFQWDKPRTDLQLMPAGSVPAPDRALLQLQAAAGFSEAATRAGDMNEAQILAGQAGLVMPGGATALQAPAHPLPDVPPASPPMRVDTLEQIVLNIESNKQKLQGLELRRKEIEARRKAIEAMGEDARNMADQAKQLRDSSQQQDKQNATDLERAARELLEKAARELEESVKRQLAEVDQDTKALDDELGQTRNDLEQDYTTLQRLTTADREDQSNAENLNAR